MAQQQIQRSEYHGDRGNVYTTAIRTREHVFATAWDAGSFQPVMEVDTGHWETARRQAMAFLTYHGEVPTWAVHTTKLIGTAD